MKTFNFSLVLRTRENTDVFISLDDNIYGIHSKRINILYLFIASGVNIGFKLPFTIYMCTFRLIELTVAWLNSKPISCKMHAFLQNSINFALLCLFDLGLTSLSTIFQSYRDGVWMWQGAQCSLLECCLTEISRPRHFDMIFHPVTLY